MNDNVERLLTVNTTAFADLEMRLIEAHYRPRRSVEVDRAHASDLLAYDILGKFLHTEHREKPTSYTLTLPYPVSTNVMWRHFRGRPVLSAKGREYKALAAQLAMDAGITPIDGDVRLEVVLHAKKTKKPTGKRPRCIDLSNSLKVAEDSLIGIAFTDDAQTRVISMAYGEPIPGGALVITVSSLKEVQ